MLPRACPILAAFLWHRRTPVQQCGHLAQSPWTASKQSHFQVGVAKQLMSADFVKAFRFLPATGTARLL
jgi:hypothetical protein